MCRVFVVDIMTLDTGDDSGGAIAVAAQFNVDIQHAFETLGSGHLTKLSSPERFS